MYLQIAIEGDPNASSADAQLWTAYLTQGGHTLDLYGESHEAIEERARELL